MGSDEYGKTDPLMPMSLVAELINLRVGILNGHSASDTTRSRFNVLSHP